MTTPAKIIIDGEDVTQLNDMSMFLSFKPTWAFKQFISCDQRIVALFTGNQAMKTSSAAYQYVLRILGMHPIPEKNVRYWECKNGHKYSFTTLPIERRCHCGLDITEHQRGSKIYRFRSQTLPVDSDTTSEGGRSSELRNTQYPEFKKWLPAFLIKKDLTSRSPSVTIYDPWGGDDIITEYCSYGQEMQAQAGVQRLSLWDDEESPQGQFEEQKPRLLAENGDYIITLTPANYVTWTYEEIYEKAAVYYRSQHVVDFIKKSENRVVPQIEKTGRDTPIAVIQAATDDNPTLSKKVIEEIYSTISDPDVLAIRRYGIFKQVSGRIFKDFAPMTHVISKEKYFPAGIPHDWVHARGIDYHAQTPWACGMMSLSKDNEAFIWGEFNPSPETHTTLEIASAFADRGGDYTFYPNLVDPYAEAVKKDSISVKDDLNRVFYELKREGRTCPTFWESWATKGEHGRDEIKLRLKNARLVGRPFNNRVNGKLLPTLWVLDTCPISAESMKSWRWEEWADTRSRNLKDEKNAPQQKHSHFNMVWECIFKHPAFRYNRTSSSTRKPEIPKFFRGRAA